MEYVYRFPGVQKQRGGNLTRMLLGCVIVYFITQIPAVIVNTTIYFSPDCCSDWQPVVSTIALINYSVNFFVYMGMSHKFRDSTWHLCQHKDHTYGTFRNRLGSSEYRPSTTHRRRTSTLFSVAWTKDRAGRHLSFPPGNYPLNGYFREGAMSPRAPLLPPLESQPGPSQDSMKKYAQRKSLP